MCRIDIVRYLAYSECFSMISQSLVDPTMFRRVLDTLEDQYAQATARGEPPAVLDGYTGTLAGLYSAYAQAALDQASIPVDLDGLCPPRRKAAFLNRWSH
jgi:hypothetical protein